MTADAAHLHSAAPRRSLFSFTDRKIGAKIALGFSAVLAVMVTLSGLAYISLDKIDANFNSFAQKVRVAGIARDVERDFLWMRRLVREFGLTGDERLLEAGLKQRQIVAEEIATALEMIKNPERRAKMKEVTKSFATYNELFDKITTSRHEFDHLTKDIVNPVGHQARLGVDRIQAWATGKDGNGAAALLAGDIMKNLLQARLNAHKTLASHDKESVEATNRYINELFASLTAFGARTSNEEMHKYVDDASALAKQFQDGFQSAERQSQEIDRLLNETARKAGEILTEELAAIKNSVMKEQSQIESETEATISSSEQLSLALATAGLLIGATLAWSIGRAISAPVKKMTDAMTSLASGHLDVDVPARGGKDEIGEMADAVQVFKDAAIAKIRRDAELEDERVRHLEAQRRAEEDAIRRERELITTSIGAGMAKLSAKDLTYRMTDDVPEAYRRLQTDFNSAIAQLETALALVASGAQAIGSGTSQIAVAADDLSKRTEQQAAGLEETAAALEEVTVTVKRSAEGAMHASDIVGTTKSEAEKSGEIVRQAVDAMGRIEKSSQQIGQIIGVIDEIAFQTNLLALNAGVEAARAGDAGKGFAVVASEVRALAQRSAEAAKEIKALVSTSSTQVDQGVELVGRTGKALEKIVAQVAEIDKVVNEIASGAREQATSLAEVNAAVGQMDQNTQKNAAMVEETTAASHNLRKETEELVRSVGGFRIDAHVADKSSARSGGATGGSATSAPRPALRTVAGVNGASAVRKPGVEVQHDSWEEF